MFSIRSETPRGRPLEPNSAAIHDSETDGAHDVDIGVIFTGESQLMSRLVPALARSGDDVRMRLVLVDNASDSGTGRWESIFDKCTVLRNERRLGYADNLNRIRQVATARYVLLLNTDMEFDPAEQCVSKMVRFMDRHTDCGISICRIYHSDDSYAFPARRYQTLRTIAARRLGLGRRFPGTLDRYLYGDRDRHDVYECDWVSGCFMMMRRAAAAEVGPFDSGFKKYFEDVDMCHRMHRSGWRVMFNGSTRCVHLEQRASKRVFSKDGWQHLRSYLRWVTKRGITKRWQRQA